MVTVTATELKNNLGRYLDVVSSGEQVMITRNGKRSVLMIADETRVSYLSDEFVGILHNDCDEQTARAERMRALADK